MLKVLSTRYVYNSTAAALKDKFVEKSVDGDDHCALCGTNQFDEFVFTLVDVDIEPSWFFVGFVTTFVWVGEGWFRRSRMVHSGVLYLVELTKSFWKPHAAKGFQALFVGGVDNHKSRSLWV